MSRGSKYRTAKTNARAEESGAGAMPIRTVQQPNDRLSALHQTVGNQEVQRLVTAGFGRTPQPPADARFRLPEFSRLKQVFTSTDLNIPEAVIKDRVTQVLVLMKKENRLKSTDPVPTIIAKIFPGGGVIDEAEFNKVVDVNDRSLIYKSVLEANMQVQSADEGKLKTAMQESVDKMEESKKDDVNLQRVFGAKKSAAKTIYEKAKNALKRVMARISSRVSTDYNLDDPEVFLGGWASYSSQHIHFHPDVVKVTDPDKSKITIIHESCHLADSSVDDKGYYGSDAFESMSEDEKITNAAHFEEVPRRKLGTSKYGNTAEFKPNQTITGAPRTFQDEVKREASEYFRKAWDKAVDIHMFLRDIRKELLRGQRTTFNTKKARIEEISRLMNLTVHEQNPAQAAVTELDIVLAEGIARTIMLIRKNELPKLTVNPPSWYTLFKEAYKQYFTRKLVEQAVKDYGVLLGGVFKDLKLLDYLVKEYRETI